MLEQFVAMVIQARKAGVSVGVLRAQLILQGMDDEETTLLIDIVALEVRGDVKVKREPVSVQAKPIDMKYKVSEGPTGTVVDCYV